MCILHVTVLRSFEKNTCIRNNFRYNSINQLNAIFRLRDENIIINGHNIYIMNTDIEMCYTSMRNVLRVLEDNNLVGRVHKL